MTIPIESLYNKSRWPSGLSLLLLIIYTPIGLIILLLRLFVSLQLFAAAKILPHNTFIRKVVLWVLYGVIGMCVREEDKEKLDASCKVLITNHITPFDHLALSLVYPCVTPSLYNLPAAISSVLRYEDVGVTRGRETFKISARQYLSNDDNPPLLLYPEGATTNANVALMKYGSWAFDVRDSVMVCGIWVYNVLPIKPSVLGASWAMDLCAMLFSPMTLYTVRYIGSMTREENESCDDFALRVQNVTADSLNLQTSQHTVSDKVEYMKRLAREEALASESRVNVDLERMALQVQEVLPHIPLHHIQTDLLQTQNVDQTITNFLEDPTASSLTTPEPSITQPLPSTTHNPQSPSPMHRPTVTTAAHYTPPHSKTPEKSSPGRENLEGTAVGTGAIKKGTKGGQSGTSGGTTTTVNTGASVFGSCALERMMSFEKRKASLIENARRKYIEKHGLNIAGYNC